MKKFAVCIVMFAALFISACAKKYYPVALQGCVENGTYRTRIGFTGPTGCNISTLVPQYYNFYNVHFLATREVYGRNYTFISLGPTVNDETIYRIMVVYKRNLPMALFKHMYFPLFMDLGARGYDRQMCKLFEGKTCVDNRPATYEIYWQSMPGIYLYYSRYQPGDVSLTHAFYYIDYDRFGVMLWIQANSNSGINMIDKKNRWRMIDQTWLPQVRFLKGFTILCKGCCNKPRKFSLFSN